MFDFYLNVEYIHGSKALLVIYNQFFERRFSVIPNQIEIKYQLTNNMLGLYTIGKLI